MKKVFLFQILLFLLFTVYFPKTFAQCTGSTCTVVSGSGGATDINKFGVCRRVTNSNSGSIVVFHNTAAEWCGTTSGCTGGSGTSSFVQRAPTNVTVASCTDITVETSWADNSFTKFCGGTCTNDVSTSATIATITTAVTLRVAYIWVMATCNSQAFQYSKNSGSWTTISTSPTDISVNQSDSLAFRVSCTGGNGDEGRIGFTITNQSDSGAVVDSSTSLQAEISD